MLLLYRLAMALFIGFGPIFIACLMFDSTKSLFQKWLMYGIGTMFSLAVLSFTVSLALDVVTAVAASLWVGKFLGANPEGISSTALQQGSVGLILTMLIVSAPPIAATFFQGTLANFSSYNQFAGGAPPNRPNAYQQQNQHNQQVAQAPRNTDQGSVSTPNQSLPQNNNPGYNNPATNSNYYGAAPAPTQQGRLGAASNNPPPSSTSAGNNPPSSNDRG
jgi:type IV secretion system protein VirB6